MQDGSDPSPGRAAPGPASGGSRRQAAPQGREERLKAALKANMGRRKAQARARAQGPEGADRAEDNDNNSNA